MSILASAVESLDNARLDNEQEDDAPREKPVTKDAFGHPSFSTRTTYAAPRAVPNRFANQTVWRKATRPSVRGK